MKLKDQLKVRWIRVSFYDHSLLFEGTVEPWVSRTGEPVPDGVKVTRQSDNAVWHLGSDRVEVWERALPRLCATGWWPRFPQPGECWVEDKQSGLWENLSGNTRTLYKQRGDGSFVIFATPVWEGQHDERRGQ